MHVPQRTGRRVHAGNRAQGTCGKARVARPISAALGNIMPRRLPPHEKKNRTRPVPRRHPRRRAPENLTNRHPPEPGAHTRQGADAPRAPAPKRQDLPSDTTGRNRDPGGGAGPGAGRGWSLLRWVAFLVPARGHVPGVAARSGGLVREPVPPAARCVVSAGPARRVLRRAGRRRVAGACASWARVGGAELPQAPSVSRVLFRAPAPLSVRRLCLNNLDGRPFCSPPVLSFPRLAGSFCAQALPYSICPYVARHARVRPSECNMKNSPYCFRPPSQAPGSICGMPRNVSRSEGAEHPRARQSG